MKKVLQIAVFSLLFLNVIFYFPSCTKDTPSSTAQQPVTLESLVLAYNVGLNIDAYKAQFLEGTMEVITLPSKEVLFFLKQADQTNNSMFLAQATDFSSKLTADLGQVKVAYLKEAIVIQDQTGLLYTFSIGEGRGNELIQKLTATWTGQGYGLAFNTHVQESVTNYKGLSSTNELRKVSCKCEASGGRSDCDSGGVGSTECSISSGGLTSEGCSVRCGGGYYACCNKS